MEALIAKLAELGLAADKAKEVAEKAAADGATDLASAALLSEADLVGYGVPKITARKIVAALAPVVEPAAPAPAIVEVVPVVGSLLPAIPDDGSFLKSLQTGGVLKPNGDDVVAAVRAFFGDQFGYFDITKVLFQKIEEHTYDNDAEFPAIYTTLRRKLRRKAHADVLEALDLPAEVVSEKNQERFMQRLQALWPALSTFHKRIVAWDESRMSKLNSSNNLVAALTGQARRIASPDTMPIVTASEEVINVINKAFAGAGVACARALAADAVQIEEVLDDPALIPAVGASSREDLIKTKLGLRIGSDAARQQSALAQFVRAVLEMPSKPVSQLPDYIQELRELGDTLDFDAVGGVSRANGKAGGPSPRSPNEYGRGIEPVKHGGNVY